jgi:hypothetical protein
VCTEGRAVCPWPHAFLDIIHDLQNSLRKLNNVMHHQSNSLALHSAQSERVSDRATSPRSGSGLAKKIPPVIKRRVLEYPDDFLRITRLNDRSFDRLVQTVKPR